MTATTTSGHASSAASEPEVQTYHDEFVARQPIFDRRGRVYAYELLFRDGVSDSCPATAGTDATRRVMEAARVTLGMQTLVGNKLAAVNFNRELLLHGYETALAPKSTIIEILETVDADDEVMQACSRLKQKGYLLALDDFVYREALEPLMRIVDIIKIRLGECELEEQCRRARRIAPYARLLAEKVETPEDYAKAQALDFRYFQGWFFCRPETLTGRALTGSHLMYLNLIQAATAPELDLDELDRLIRTDVSLAHRFMKFLGSAAFGWTGPFSSVRHGLALLGDKLTRRWASLISLDEMAEGKPQELLVNAAVRAKVCEDLAPLVGLDDREQDLFFLGSLSLIDTMMDRPMEMLVKELTLEKDVETALLGRSNPLRQVLDLATAYERGEWERCSTLCAELGVDEAELAPLYADGVSWASDVFAL